MTTSSTKFRAHGRKDIDTIPQLAGLDAEERLAMKAVSAVLPFRTNAYVLDHLIDWDRVPEDPMYQLTIPQRGMLEDSDFERMRDLVHRDAPEEVIQQEAYRIQMRLRPHPAGQMELNVPRQGGRQLPGMQHKYAETVLFFPGQGQTCHAYCTYCFRWAQFVGIDELKFAAREVEVLVEYLRRHREVRSVLLTGGDPMIMKAANLERYVEPLLGPGLEHVRSIRIGTKALSYWPQRFVSDADAGRVLRLFEKVVAAGKQLALMAHYTLPVELSTDVALRAVAAVRSTGAVIRSQSPLVAHVNDDVATWHDLWARQLPAGIVPYYMFVERDTGPRQYFAVPLERAYDVFRRAYANTSGLGRTVRGPSMSATPGKVCVEGVAEVYGQKVFVLTFLQARNPDWVKRPFFAKYDPEACWLTDLEPAFGAGSFFYEEEMERLESRPRQIARRGEAVAG